MSEKEKAVFTDVFNNKDYTQSEIDSMKENFCVVVPKKVLPNRKKEEFAKLKKDRRQFVDMFDNFFFLSFNKVLELDLEKQMVIRLLRLCCDLDYDNVVRKNQLTMLKMTNKEVGEILNLQERETKKTMSYIKQRGLIKMNENKEIKVNDDFVVKGKLQTSNKKQTMKDGYVRIFEDGFKELYDNCNPRDHKKLFFFIQILPYVNIYYNILCLNPLESDLNKIEILTWNELMKILKIESAQASWRIKQNLLSLKIKEKHVIMIITQGKNQGVTINPRIYYKGNNNLNMIKGLINSFDLMENTHKK